ncbi:hypothetical protein GCM10009841_10470 [Microlunatus panaciterrae]|uniref:Secreted protein n=1 Tax=Microlunatus panaciterrae TaxID=400768 RepID=A0ABS2RN30_9ACTN|nr:hypothetical protein [Microlunatus panaciterrae]MBM7799606.1 hypothetical protein [Microlunatus panaciterrae]
MVQQPDAGRQVAKEARLWVLALVCATGGATAVALSDSLAIGVAVFLGLLGVLGPILYAYEKKQRR